MRKTYFKISEFLQPQLPESERMLWENWKRLSSKSTLDILDKIQMWTDILNPIRKNCKFPIVITDGLRLHGRVSSQHRYFGDGALDIRPPLHNIEDRTKKLATELAEASEITRVCYYMPSSRFPHGGFHIDRKSDDKQFFLNRGSEIKWEYVGENEFLNNI